jgi:transposase
LLQVPPSTDIVVGIDTHKHIHAAVALSALGARLGATTVPASRAGYRRIAAWARSLGTVMAFGVEGTRSCGAGLARALREAGHRVLDVNRPDRSARRRNGKTTCSTPRPRRVPSSRAEQQVTQSPAPAPSR